MPGSQTTLRRILAFAGLFSLSLCCSILHAQTPHATQYTYEHSNGLWLGIQDDNQSAQQEDVFLLDQGRLSSIRSSEYGSDIGEYSYGLGVDQDGHTMNQVRGQYSWFRRTPRHDLRLAIDGVLETYRGTTSLLSLDQQYSLGDSQGGITNQLNDYIRREGRVTASDLIRLSPTTDANVSGSHQRSFTDINSRGTDNRTLDTITAGLEQRWYQSSLTFDILHDTLLAKIDDTNGGIDFNTRQNTSERILRYIFPLIPRLSGRVGYRDIRLSIKDGPNLYRHGPEIGTDYIGEAWNWGIELSSLRDEDNQSETFGRAYANWLMDERNRFSARVEKSISLQSTFAVLPGERDALIRPQQSVLEKQLEWERSYQRHRFTLGVLQSDLLFEGAEVIYAEESLLYAYSLSELTELTARLAFNQSKFNGGLSLNSGRRENASFQVGVRHILKGALSATGGRMFVESTLGVEQYRETPIPFKSSRVALLLSLGQIGNF